MEIARILLVNGLVFLVTALVLIAESLLDATDRREQFAGAIKRWVG